MAAIQSGDEEAFAAAYDSYSRTIYGTSSALSEASLWPRDLLQEVFLKLWRSSATLDEKAVSLGPWLCAVARHQVLDHFKSGQNQRAMKSTPLDICELPKRFSVPAFDITSKERAKHLLAGLDRLEARQRHMLEMAYFEGLTQIEMAGRMNMPLGTVKSCVRSALRNLKEYMDRSGRRRSQRAAGARSRANACLA